MDIRRDFELPEEDQRFLTEYGLPWETIIDGSPWVLVHQFPTHEGYTVVNATAAIRIETGYPRTALDMVYFHPHIKRKDGQLIRATDAIQRLDGKDFQRWSRHRTGQHPWREGIDNLGNHILLIEDWLEREFDK